MSRKTWALMEQALRAKNEAAEAAVKRGLQLGWKHVHVWLERSDNVITVHTSELFPENTESLMGDVERIDLGDGILNDWTKVRQ